MIEVCLGPARMVNEIGYLGNPSRRSHKAARGREAKVPGSPVELGSLVERYRSRDAFKEIFVQGEGTGVKVP